MALTPAAVMRTAGIDGRIAVTRMIVVSTVTTHAIRKVRPGAFDRVVAKHRPSKRDANNRDCPDQKYLESFLAT
jgi:hypothetical protein